MTFKVSGTTAVNEHEYKPGQYVIPFAPELVDFILEEKKLKTYRYGNKYNYLQVGDIVKIQNSESKKVVAAAVIVTKSQTAFKDLPLSDNSHETYKDKEHQRRVLSGYYAYINRAINDEDKFLVFGFKLVKT